MNPCNNTSVGVVLKKDDCIFLIKRKNFPYGFACPSGHLEKGETYEQGAIREIKEETSFDICNLRLLHSQTKNLSCKRGGEFHNWRVFIADYSGEADMQISEVSDGNFYNGEFVRRLIGKTEAYLRKEISEEDWQRDPGMEVVWYDFFKDLNL